MFLALANFFACLICDLKLDRKFPPQDGKNLNCKGRGINYVIDLDQEAQSEYPPFAMSKMKCTHQVKSTLTGSKNCAHFYEQISVYVHCGCVHNF